MKNSLLIPIILSLAIACGNVENIKEKEKEDRENVIKHTTKLTGEWYGNDGVSDFVYIYREDGSFVHKMMINKIESIDYIGTYEYLEDKNIIKLKWTDCNTNSRDPEYLEIAKNKRNDFKNPLIYEENIEWIDDNSFIPELNGIFILIRKTD